MPAALPLQTSISQANQGDTTYRVIEVHYGNGYSQRAGDGINNNQAMWNIAYENINSTDLGTIVTAFDTANGTDYFTWTAPGDGSSKKWVVAKYSRSQPAGGVYTVQASLAQVFDL